MSSERRQGRGMRARHMSAGLALFAFGLWYGYQASMLPDRTLPHAPGPAFFPWVLTAALIGLSIALFWMGLRSPREQLALAPPAAGRSAAVALTLFAAHVIALPWLGFLAAGMPFFAGLMWIGGERRLTWLLAAGAGIPIILFAIFRYGFRITLPSAALWGW